MYTMEDIEAVDMEIAQAIKDEFDRQNSHIELDRIGELGKPGGDVCDGKRFD